MFKRACGVAAVVSAAILLAACGKQGVEMGQGGSVVTGSGGPQGAQSAAKQLVKCDAPVAVVSLVENQGGYQGIGRGGLPESPLPLVRVLMQQSGCFRIVDRNAGLKATVHEQELKDQGILRADGDVKKGRGIMAQYSVVPSLNFSEQDAGRQIGGILAASPVLNKFAGAAEQVPFKEAQPDLNVGADEHFMYLDMVTTPGQSGGPVVDSEGRVVTINQLGDGINSVDRTLTEVYKHLGKYWEKE